MNKTMLAIPAAAMIALAGPVPDATADTPTCVSHAEYRQVHRGDTRVRVNRIFDVSGHREVHASSGGYQTEIRSYRTCSRYSVVSIAFDKNGTHPWKVSAKSAVWVG